MEVNVYDAMVEIEAEKFDIEVYEAEGPALVGMALLTGFRLTVEVTTDGAVMIERIR